MSNDKALATREQSPLAPFRKVLASAMPSLNQALPETVRKYLTPERLTKITLAAIGRTPLLMKCSPESVARSVLDAASLGLDPAGGALGHAYLVPYRNKNGGYDAQLIVGYRGYIALARRSGEIQSVEAHVVYEKDDFVLEYGIEPKLRHVPVLTGDRGEIVAGYCIASFVGGGRHCEVMTRGEIDAIMLRSRARDNGPWKTDFAEMARKTVVRRAAKYWPLSTELARAMDMEDRAEGGDDGGDVAFAVLDGGAELPEVDAKQPKTKRLAAKARANTQRDDDESAEEAPANEGADALEQALDVIDQAENRTAALKALEPLLPKLTDEQRVEVEETYSARFPSTEAKAEPGL